MNSRRFAGGYNEVLPEDAALPSILTKGSIKQALSGPREWAQSFDFYTIDALVDNGAVSAHEQEDIEQFLAIYGGEEAQQKQDTIMRRMIERSFENAAFNQPVDELHFHSINRVMVSEWRHLLFGAEYAPDPIHIALAQERLAVRGMELVVLSRLLAEKAKRAGISSTAHAQANVHATEIDTAITLLEYQKLRTEETGKHDTVIIPASPRFRHGPEIARRAHFLVVNTDLQTVRGVRPKLSITSRQEVEQEYDQLFVTPIDGVLDLGNFGLSKQGSESQEALQLIPEPGLISVGFLVQHEGLSIGTAVRYPEFSSRTSINALITAKSAAHNFAAARPTYDFSLRATDAARRISGRIDADLRRKLPPNNNSASIDDAE